MKNGRRRIRIDFIESKNEKAVRDYTKKSIYNIQMTHYLNNYSVLYRIFYMNDRKMRESIIIFGVRTLAHYLFINYLQIKVQIASETRLRDVSLRLIDVFVRFPFKRQHVLAPSIQINK